MLYTLTMGLVWFALALVLGTVIGYLMRSVTAHRQVARARATPVDTTELEQLRRRVAELEPVVAERDSLRARITQHGPDALDVDEARRVLGHDIVLDDLAVVDGLGPGVRELCHGIGICTWNDLADTEVSLLRTMLDDAGARFHVHDPTTWPAQARLLATGRWVEFRELIESLRSASPSAGASG